MAHPTGVHHWAAGAHFTFQVPGEFRDGGDVVFLANAATGTHYDLGLGQVHLAGCGLLVAGELHFTGRR